MPFRKPWAQNARSCHAAGSRSEMNVSQGAQTMHHRIEQVRPRCGGRATFELRAYSSPPRVLRPLQWEAKGQKNRPGRPK